MITGIESDLLKTTHNLETVGYGAFDEVKDVLFHPETTIKTFEKTLEPAWTESKTFGENLVYHPIKTLENVVVGAYDTVKQGVKYLNKNLDSTLQNLDEDRTMLISELEDDQLTGERKVVLKKVPMQDSSKQSTRVALKSLLKSVIIILILISILIVLYFAFFSRYSLVRQLYSSGNHYMSSALLTPELSLGLSTLAAAL
jgi:uncharacterized membrane protein YqjE